MARGEGGVEVEMMQGQRRENEEGEGGWERRARGKAEGNGREGEDIVEGSSGVLVHDVFYKH